MTKRRSVIIILLLFFLSGCSASLSEEKESFNGAGRAYEFQLPSTWKKQEDSVVKNNFGEAAVFGAEDAESDSFMYVLVFAKEEIDFENFGEQTRENLQKTHGYEALEDVFMKEYEVNGYPAFKYTLNTSFENESIWAHFYYITTENGLVQFNFFSADDRNYEKRVEILNESADSLLEKDVATITGVPENSEEASGTGDEMSVENDRLKFEVTGYRKVVVEEQEYLAVRFTLLNKGDTPIKPTIWYEKAQLMLGDQKLERSEFPEDESIGNLKELASTNEETLEIGEAQEGLAFYKLPSQQERMVSLLFNEDEFEQQDEIQMDLSVFDE